MEISNVEVKELKEVEEQAEETATKELAMLGLACVGGGSGQVIFG